MSTNTSLVSAAASQRLNDYFGKGDNKFGLLSGYDSKFEIDRETNAVSWKGVSGLLQWFHRWPFGFGVMKDTKLWVKMNQIFWNLLVFVLIYGSIYKAMIESNSLKVPDNIKSRTNNTFLQGVYFSLVTMVTLGFGDIVPYTTGAQVAVTSQIVLFVLFNFIWVIKYDIRASI